ncbi:MAG: beta-phosphoglucomutase [Bacillota bacterium]
MAQLKACLFDLDGVIVDTAKYHYLAWKRLADELGFVFTEHDNERLKGVSRVRSLEILLEIGGISRSEEEKAMMATRKNEWYVDYIKSMDESEILPGVTEFLASLKANGIKIALGSASKNAGMILTNIGMMDTFDAIIDGNKTSEAKPDPEVFLLGAEALGVAAEECVVFEDAEAGVEAAIRAHMHVIGIGSPEQLAAADFTIKQFTELTLKQVQDLFN